MSIFDKAKNLLNDEGKTDAVLDKAEQFAKDKLGKDKSGQIRRVRDTIDDRVGGSDSQDSNSETPRDNENREERPDDSTSPR